MNKIHYCPISPIQRQFGLYVTGAGHELTKPSEPYPHEYHSSDYYFTWRNGRALADWEYQLLYIREGKGTIQFKRGKSIAIGGGTIIILHPGEWHRYRPDPKTGWSEAYIGIGGEFLERMFAEPFFRHPPTLIQLEPDGRFDHDLIALVDEIQANSVEHPYTLAMKTMELVASLFERPANLHGKAAYNVVIRRANLHIAHHLGEVVDFPALAHQYGMGYSLFRKCFQSYNGMAPLEYQIALRMRRAMHLLASSNVPIAQIAEETGFQSSSYFSKFFRKRLGTSPILFRRSNLTDKTRHPSNR
jgi:AraC-like DNA-binding protein